MPPLKTYDLFISHSWKYNDDYYRLINLLSKANNFTYRNYSVPMHDSLDTATDKELYAALDRQIKPVNIVIILAGMYSHYSKWIEKEIELAQSYKKPIIAIKPSGQEMTPLKVTLISKTVVSWNTDSIVQAIRTYSL